jgi:hypothetical protein
MKEIGAALKSQKVLIIYNHEYQIKKVLINEPNGVFLKINEYEKTNNKDTIIIPYIDGASLLRIFATRRVWEYKLSSIIKCYDRIIIFGCQDYLSYYSYRKSAQSNIQVSIVPDNMEFFVRPGFIKSKFKLRIALKSFLLGFNLKELDIEYSYFLNRIIYKINNEDDIDYKYSFLDVVKFTSAQNNKMVFISQPYYLDHKLNLKDWSKVVERTMESFKERGYDVFIKFHQRDSDEFKHIMLGLDYKSYFGDLDSKHSYTGIFSTLLFELAASNRNVFSCYRNFEHFFSTEYQYFVCNLSSLFSIDLHSNANFTSTIRVKNILPLK